MNTFFSLLLTPTLLALTLLNSLAAADRYDFPVDQVRWYRYALTQTVAWGSAGDNLQFDQRVIWTFALRATAVSGDTATVNATITRIEATSKGPGSDRSYDSEATTAADPLFGHLTALIAAPMTLTVNQITGEVTAVGGHELIEKRLTNLLPAAAPGQPSPFASEIAQRYNAESLRTWWSSLLSLQSAPVISGITGSDAKIERTWKDANAYTLALSATTPTPTITLVDGSSPVTGTLRNLTGTGSIAIDNGMPIAATGSMQYSLDLVALTQKVEQKHGISWGLEQMSRADAK